MAWLYLPKYLTQIVPGTEVLPLLLAGIVERLSAPVVMWEERETGMEPVYPVDHMERYPDFCKAISMPDFAERLGLSTKALSTLSKLSVQCHHDSSTRASNLLHSTRNETCNISSCTCHLNLITCSAPVQFDGKNVAICTSGKFISPDSEQNILKILKSYSLDANDLKIMHNLISLIEKKDVVQANLFKQQLASQIDILQQLSLSYLLKFRGENEWAFRSDLGSRLNQVALKKGINWQAQVLPILQKIKEFFNVPYVALFCSAKPGDTSLPLFAQVGLENLNIRDVTFNWRRAFESTVKDENFDSYAWLDHEAKPNNFPSEFLRKGLRGTGNKQLANASFVLPYLYGNHYRGVFILGNFKSSMSPKDLLEHNVFSGVGHLVISRVLALIAIDALNERANWRELITKLWAHAIRDDLKSLMGEAYEIEKRLDKFSVIGRDKDRLTLAMQRINNALDEMKYKMKLTMKSPEGAIASLLDRTELSLAIYPLSALVHNGVERIRNWASNFGVSIITDPSIDDLPSAQIDLRLLGLVLNNILDNAIKYSKKTSQSPTIYNEKRTHIREVRIYSRLLNFNQWAEIIVENYGVGIPSEEQYLIYEPNFRSELADATEGVGIGLYQAKCFLELQDGEISHESYPAFRGASIKSDYITKFIISLPTVFLKR